MEKIRLIELFSGYGSQALALRRLGLEVDHVAISEIDKYAIGAHEALHGKVPNLGDITQIDILPPCDLLTYSFPCQDLSCVKMGEKKGLDGERSGLLFEVARLVNKYKKEHLPRVLMLENVKEILSSKNERKLNKWLQNLETLGYKNYIFKTNALAHNVPQNRERVIIISLLNGSLHWERYSPVSKDECISLQDFLFGDKAKKYDKNNIVQIGVTNDTVLGKKLREHISLLHNGLLEGRSLISIPVPMEVSGRVGNIMHRCITARGDIPFLYDSTINKVRRLEADEFFKLQGLNTEETKTILSYLNNSRNRAKILAGNSICVNMLVDIFAAVYNVPAPKKIGIRQKNSLFHKA